VAGLRSFSPNVMAAPGILEAYCFCSGLEAGERNEDVPELEFAMVFLTGDDG
jgi:hypothetical protein